MWWSLDHGRILSLAVTKRQITLRDPWIVINLDQNDRGLDRGIECPALTWSPKSWCKASSVKLREYSSATDYLGALWRWDHHYEPYGVYQCSDSRGYRQYQKDAVETATTSPCWAIRTRCEYLHVHEKQSIRRVHDQFMPGVSSNKTARGNDH